MEFTTNNRQASDRSEGRAHFGRRGGRMTKWKGIAASYAPQATGSFMSLALLAAALAGSTSLMSASPAYASNCGDGSAVVSGGSCDLNLNGYDPDTNDNQVGATIVNGGDAVTLTGVGSDVTPGTYNNQTYDLPGLLATGAIVSGAQYADPGNPASLVVNVGLRNRVVSVTDAITGATRTVLVYDNAAINDTYAASNSVTAAVIRVNCGDRKQQISISTPAWAR